MSDRDEVAEQSGAVHRRDVGRLIHLLLIAAIIVILVVVALDNREDARLGYVVGERLAPTWIVIVAAAAAGVVMGWLVRHRPRRRV